VGLSARLALARIAAWIAEAETVVGSGHR
jgi:hypothetical protein